MLIKCWNQKGKVTLDMPETPAEPVLTFQEIVDAMFSRFKDMLKGDSYGDSENAAKRLLPALQNSERFKQLAMDVLWNVGVDMADFNQGATFFAWLVVSGYLVADSEFASRKLAASLGQDD